ncbi:MAG: hypothetical protein M1830_002470 [Pleopsidium flavum]|nr:MAG: hypothetical protein M1830_002470 [Pleopsidium flavum]
MATDTPSPTPLKVLMLHGYTQSGPLFHAKTRALEKALHKALPSISLCYPTAPLRLRAPDIPGSSPSPGPDEEPDAWAWWRRKDDSYEYAGIEQGLARIAETLDAEGPFVGVIGFSQGGCAAGMVASLLEPGRQEAFSQAQGKGGMRYPESFARLRHPPLRFAVSYSGFGAPHELYGAFYEPKIRTPMAHFIGSLDTVVEEARSRRLVDACVNGARGRVVYHPGGHFLPTQKQFLNVLIGFIQETIADRVEGEGEEGAEDIPVSF